MSLRHQGDHGHGCLQFHHLRRPRPQSADGGDHVVYDDGVLAVDIIPQKFMCYDGILAVYDGRVIPSFIEHAGIYSQYVGEVNAAVQSALIRTDDNGVFLVDDKIPFRAQQRLDKLVGRREVVKALGAITALPTR